MTIERREMSAEPLGQPGALRALEAPTGGFAMLALDQRESLRRMFPPADGREVGDDTLRGFKREALAALSPLASAVLLDRLYAMEDRRPPELAAGAALILAADVLVQPPGLPVVTTSLDPEVTPELVARVGADALKLLVIWADDGAEAEREALVRSFVELSEASGVPSLVEGIVRPADGGEWTDAAARHEAILRAAEELAGYGGSIYKAEVPGYAPGDLSLVREHAERLTGLVPVPWVVLSNGVRQPDFAEALRQSVLGGASGFLAGRAIWADTVPEEDPAAALRARSVGRLEALARIVAESRAS